MVTHLRNKYPVAFYLVNYPMLFVDAAGPITGQIVAEMLGLSNSLIPVSLNVTDKVIYSQVDFSICFLPIAIVFPGVLRENEPHSISPRSLPFPLSNSSMDSQSLAALAGL
jgi:hypothetical protein